MRIEAQKQIWSLCRYKNVPYIICKLREDAVRDLIWHGEITFQHCSPSDPDYQVHFIYRWMDMIQLHWHIKLAGRDNEDDILGNVPIYFFLEDIVR